MKKQQIVLVESCSLLLCVAFVVVSNFKNARAVAPTLNVLFQLYQIHFHKFPSFSITGENPRALPFQ